MASVWTLQFHTVSFQHRVSPSLLEFRARFWLDRGGYNSFNRSYILKRIELRAARNSLNGDDVRQLPEKSNFVESKNKIILIPKNVITKLQVTVGSCPPIVFLTKKHPGAGFAVGIFVIATLLIIAVRNHMLRKSRYSSPGTVADLVRRGQLRSDRRGISSPLKYEDPFNNPMVKVSKSNSTVEMGGKVYRLAPVTLTRAPLAFLHSHPSLLQISREPPNHCSLRRAMSGASEKGLITTATRRVASVANHLLPPQPAPCSLRSIVPSNCSSSMNDSYHRVHGEVPAHVLAWRLVPSDESGKEFTDIIYEKAVGEAIAKITINRPERRNAFRPHTIKELIRAFNDARDDGSVGVIILTGKGTKAFCSGGDQALRNKDGYVDYESFGRLNVLDLQVQIRRLPKPVIAMVAGYAVGGGHVLHMVCDLTIAADNAIFGQTGPKVGSFDAGYGSSIMSRLVGPKKAREMWFLTRFYAASEAEKMGLVNTVVPLEKLEQETIKWCREILRNSPTAIRVLKSALNAVDDGHTGLQGLGGDATLLFYGTDEGNEGKNAYVQRRPPDFSKFPRLP